MTTFPAQVSAGPPSMPAASTEVAAEEVTEVIRSRGVTWSLSGGRMGSHAKPAQRGGSIGSRDASASPTASK